MEGGSALCTQPHAVGKDHSHLSHVSELQGGSIFSTILLADSLGPWLPTGLCPVCPLLPLPPHTLTPLQSSEVHTCVFWCVTTDVAQCHSLHLYIKAFKAARPKQGGYCRSWEGWRATELVTWRQGTSPAILWPFVQSYGTRRVSHPTPFTKLCFLGRKTIECSCDIWEPGAFPWQTNPWHRDTLTGVYTSLYNVGTRTDKHTRCLSLCSYEDSHRNIAIPGSLLLTLESSSFIHLYFCYSFIDRVDFKSFV